MQRVKSIKSRRVAKRTPPVGGPLAPSKFTVLEASVGNAKYEIAHEAVVWRLSRFPEKNAGEYIIVFNTFKNNTFFFS